MHRRSFLKTTAATSLGVGLLPSFLRPELLAVPVRLPSGSLLIAADDALGQGFLNPPASAKPCTFWKWMNGNISREGITLDLEAMKQMGLAGIFLFNAATDIPRGPADFAGPAWTELLEHTLRESQRLGLELSMHNAPGYSGTGGPWITPATSMLQMVWTEAQVRSNGRQVVQAKLAQPLTKRSFYQDTFVLAYPSLLVETTSMWTQLRRITLDGQPVDAGILRDVDVETHLRMVPANGQPAILLLEFTQPYEARAISLHRRPEAPLDPNDGPRDYPPRFRLEASDDGQTFRPVADIQSPALREMDVASAQSFPAVKARYFRLVTAQPSYLSDLTLHQGPRLPFWPAKTGTAEYDDTMRTTEEVAAELVIAPDKVLNISQYLDSQGRLNWKAPAGSWTVVRLGYTTTGEVCAAAPDSGQGLQCDKYSKAGLDAHFNGFLTPLIARMKPYVGKSFTGLHTDSWEAGKQNWTPNLPTEFQQRQGYDLVPYLLTMTGRIVGSVDQTERFLWDLRRTFADLLSENYYGYYRTRCHAVGLKFSGEPYGDGNFDSLQVAQNLDTPLGEFWTRYTYGGIDYIRLVSSAAHLYGSPVAMAEAFTGEPRTSKFTDYPYSLKSEGDWMFAMGVNRLLFHTFAHQPHPTAKPGMTMGPFGMHFDRNSTWAQQAHGWTGYLARAQFLLQQGNFVADLCYFKGDTFSAKLPGNAILRPVVPLGYAADITGRDALLTRFSVQNNRLTLPNGLSYRLLILPTVAALSVEVLRKVRELIQAGASVLVQEPPTTVPGQAGFGKPGETATSEAALRTLVQEIWGNLDGKTVTEHSVGPGKVFRGVPLETLLPQLGVQPDFEYSSLRNDTALHYIHRRLDDADIYFISNHHRRTEDVVCTFRVAGRQPELWDAETGRQLAPAVFVTEGGRTRLPIQLAPSGSVFVVFRRAAVPQVAGLLLDDKPLLASKVLAAAVAALYADVQNDFSITLWAKPDVLALPGRGFLFYPPAGAAVYGSGHAACALTAGLNGVRVFERTDRLTEVVFAEQKLTGWTHLALVYREGQATLYINGKTVAQGKKSASIVHPGLHTPAALEQFMVFFEGDKTEPQLSREALSEAQVQALYQQGLPEELALPAVELTQDATGHNLRLRAWQAGNYELQPVGEGRARRVRVRSIAAPQLLSQPWQVSFQGSGVGIPKPITLPALASLHQHPDFEVRHFSGTAVYISTFELRKPDEDQRLYLDLGRVSILAEVKLNGQELGQVWKAPFRLDITPAVRVGQNTLEVRVTNLWVNRHIGDEYLPAEADYQPWGAIKKLPNWYRQGQPKPGARTLFSTWHEFDKTDPLLESGLLGPVRILTAVEKTI